ncbi:MAG TPA: exopolysaccharide biosynthesis protein [Chthonomonadaceae bacterium]|nr:exopolysaccharide biosynthesis protein [Chthonomonadaceae bacterium]
MKTQTGTTNEITAEAQSRSQETLSGLLRSALDTDHDGRVSVGEIQDRVAERGFGLLLILLTLPMLIPMPPGTSGPVGLLIALLGFQMLAGRAYPWLPARVRRYRLPAKALAALQTQGVAFMERLERLSRPRWRGVENPIMLRILAVLLILGGLVLFLPLPFLNTLPALFLLPIGVGLLNRDGASLLLGLALNLGLAVFLAFSAHLFVHLFETVRGWLA